jgi:hypothetical protein
MARTLTIAFASIAVFAVPAWAATPAHDYDVRLVVRDGDKPPTSPRLMVRAGGAATFMIANERYSMRLVATPDASGRVNLASNISTWHRDGLHNDASTINVAADGQPSTILMPHIDPGTGEARQLRVEVSIRPATD